MSSFTGKSPAFLEATLVNDGFFPDITLGDLQKLYRVPAEYTQELVEHHLRLAMMDCNRPLSARKAEWITKGFNTLADVSQIEIGGEKELVIEYRRAVYCRAMGLLVRAFTTMNRKVEAENLAKEGPDVSGDYLAQSSHAVRRLLGMPQNITAELI